MSVLTDGELAEWVEDAALRLTDLVADLDDEQLSNPQKLPIVNPLDWEIGHITWFQEAFVLRGALSEPPVIEHADAIWDSGAVPHDTRWYLRLPPRHEILDYIQIVTERVADRLRRRGSGEQLHHIARYAVHHHDMHTEALTYTRQTLGHPAPTLAGVEVAAAPEAGGLGGDAAVPGGWFDLGARRGHGFAHDNEKWAHPVWIDPFAIARAPVTQREFADFVDAGGYRRRELWSPAGLRWLRAAGRGGPMYWRAGPEGWQRRDFDRWVPLEPHRPVCNVNWYEADAYCRWGGRRLPSEAEWEAAALAEPDAGGSSLAAGKRDFPWGSAPVSAQRGNTEWRHMSTVDVAAYPNGDSAFGVRGLIGNVWEWTADTFGPFPGFEQDAYRDNSATAFDSAMVLRGGAWATRSRFLRGTVRNYFTPDRSDVLAGFRTVSCE